MKNSIFLKKYEKFDFVKKKSENFNFLENRNDCPKDIKNSMFFNISKW